MVCKVSSYPGRTKQYSMGWLTRGAFKIAHFPTELV